MPAMFEFHREIPLTEDELDKVLAAADEELLQYARAAACPEEAILRIMAFEESSSGSTGKPGCSGARWRRLNWRLIGTIAACLILLGFCASRAAAAIITYQHQPGHRRFREAEMRSAGKPAGKEVSFIVSFGPHRYDITPAAGSELSLILKVSRIWHESNVTISAYASRSPGSVETVTLADERIKAVQSWLAARAAAGVLHTTTRVVADQATAQFHEGLAMVRATPYAAPRCGRNATGCPP